MSNHSTRPYARNEKGCFITGSDTGVGKTVITAALALACQARGKKVGVMKPVETGVQGRDEKQSDAERLRRCVSPSEPQNVICPYSFASALVPITASRSEGIPIDITQITSAYQSMKTRYEYILVEGIGGLCVPISATHVVRDLITLLGLPCIIVSRTSLGAINHTLLTLEGLNLSGIQVLAIIFNHPHAFPKTSEQILQCESTVHVTRELSRIPVLGPLQHHPALEQNWDTGVVTLSAEPCITQLADLLLKTD